MDIYSSSDGKKGKHVYRKAKRPMTKKKKKIMIALIATASVLAVLLISILGVFIYLTVDYNHKGILDDEINSIQPISEGIVNIALFGIDSRDEKSFQGLSDSIMILSVNTDTGQLKLISIMRDTLVPIPGYSTPKKINSAYSLGGPELAIKTLNENFGLDIKEYATVNFYGMADIIDAVGGLEIEVTQGEISATYGINAMIQEQSLYMKIDPEYVKTPGLQTLNGVQAVSWARIRHAATSDGVNDDYGRTDRQREVMEKLLNKVLTMSKTKYTKLIKTLLPYMETSLSYSDVLKLAGIFLKDVQFTQTRVPQQDYVLTSPSGFGSVVYFNLDFASEIIYSYIYEDIAQEDYIEQNGIVKTGWYSGSSSGGGSTTGSSGSSGGSGGTTVTSSVNTPSEVPSSSEAASSEDASSTVSGTVSETESTDIGTSEPESPDNPDDGSEGDTSSDTVTSEDTGGASEESPE